MVDRVCRSAPVKKISDSWRKSATAGVGQEDKKQTDPFNTGEKVTDSSGYLVKTYFGDELLYACYEFYDRFKNKPRNWLEVFDFLRFMKVKGIFRDIALQGARGE